MGSQLKTVIPQTVPGVIVQREGQGLGAALLSVTADRVSHMHLAQVVMPVRALGCNLYVSSSSHVPPKQQQALDVSPGWPSLT